jgi:heptosyltransferase-2
VSRKVLIIKLAAIGDVIMALPMIEEVRKSDPNTGITWLCGRTIAPLLHEIGGIDDVIAIDDSRLLSANLFGRFRTLLSIWIRLFGRKFNLVVIGHADWRYRLLTLTLRADIIRTFTRDRGRLWPIPGRHHADEYVRLITGYDGPESVPITPLNISPPLPERLKEKLQATSYSSSIAIAPGGAKNVLHEDALRRWPLADYAALADMLIRAGHRVVLTGAPDDAWVRESFDGLPVIDFIGETNLIELIALYHSCDVVVTHDSGPMHLAGLAGTPLVALFGPTNPYEKVPHDTRTKIIWGGENLACRPCYDGRTYADCRDNQCLKSISPDRIFEAVGNILKNKTGIHHQ